VTVGEARVATTDLNLRSGPSTSEPVLLTIPAGGSVTLTGDGQQGGFVAVEYQGVRGWVYAQYLG
jgi:uncharacterized protein YraI